MHAQAPHAPAHSPTRHHVPMHPAHPSHPAHPLTSGHAGKTTKHPKPAHPAHPAGHKQHSHRPPAAKQSAPRDQVMLAGDELPAWLLALAVGIAGGVA